LKSGFLMLFTLFILLTDLVMTGCGEKVTATTGTPPKTTAPQPTATTTPATTSLSATAAPAYSLLPGQTIYSEGATGKDPPVMSHPWLGFEKCVTCHYPGTTGGLRLVYPTHSCQECHSTRPMPAWGHFMANDWACVICHNEP